MQLGDHQPTLQVGRVQPARQHKVRSIPALSQRAPKPWQPPARARVRAPSGPSPLMHHAATSPPHMIRPVCAPRMAGSNMMIVAIDSKLPQWLDENQVAYWRRVTSAAGSHKISAQKFQYVREFLTIGCSVLMSDIDVVYLQNPFLFIHHDSVRYSSCLLPTACCRDLTSEGRPMPTHLRAASTPAASTPTSAGRRGHHRRLG